MVKKYLVWKDRNCNGINPEWVQMTGTQFHEFVTLPENRARTFIKTPIDPDHLQKGFYKIEVTPEKYMEFDAKRKKRERSTDLLDLRRIRYKEISRKGHFDFDAFYETNNDKEDIDISSNEADELNSPCIPCVISMEDSVDAQEDLTIQDIVADSDVNVEEDAIRKFQLEAIYKATNCLTDTEKKIFDSVFKLNSKNRSLRAISKDLGYSHQYVSKKVTEIIKKLKKVVAEN